MEIRRFFDPVTEEQVAALEQRLGRPLPADYRAFLLEYNGGFPRPNVYFISERQGETNLEILFGITAKTSLDLWSNALDAYADYDRTLLPIGEDGGGNQVMLSLAPDTIGHAFFADHETEGGLIRIADSFTDLLSRLHA